MLDSPVLPDRFWEKITPEPNTGCWLWIGAVNSTNPDKAYGQFAIAGTGKSRPAHRVSYETFIGNIPKDMQIDHLCRTKRCVNPFHLEPVTQRENIRRAARDNPDHGNNKRSHCQRGHAYEPDNNLIFQLKNGKTRRQCLICTRAYLKQWRIRNKAKRQSHD